MISGEKVQLRGVTYEDSTLIYQWVNLEDLRDLTGTLYPVSEYEHDNWMKSVTTSNDRKLFAIYMNNRCIGTIGLKNIDYISRNAELFISIGDNSAKSSGGGTDAVHTLVDFCFMHLNIHKVYLHVFESNKRAIRCYEKAGFHVEGTLYEHHFSQGKYENVLVMGKINKPKESE